MRTSSYHRTLFMDKEVVSNPDNFRDCFRAIAQLTRQNAYQFFNETTDTGDEMNSDDAMSYANIYAHSVFKIQNQADGTVSVLGFSEIEKTFVRAIFFETVVTASWGMNYDK